MPRNRSWAFCLVLFSLVQSPTGWAEALRWDSSGAAGRSGQSGRGGSDGFGWGYGYRGYYGWGFQAPDGDDGQHGGNGEPGESAGDIDLNLFTAPGEGQPARLEIRGTVGRRVGNRKVATTVTPSPSLSLSLRARGGDGGFGGDGGEGGDGAWGMSGSDATEYSAAGNGQNGGDGGDGGDAGSGGEGGDGGRITVNAKAQDTHWLMLIDDVSIQGGNGGVSGKPGRGGSGGLGGMGGFSYSDDDTYHSGGWSGMPGSDGRSGRPGASGRNGRKGEFEIVVTYPDNSTRSCRERYDMGLEGFQLVNDSKHGVYEPGDFIRVKSLTVRNTGGMPTPPPPNSYVEVSLDGGEWLEIDPKALRLPKVLKPGEAYTFKDRELTFRVRDVHRSELPKVGEPLREYAAIKPKATLTTVDRRFPHFDKPQNISIQFPVEIRPVRGLAALPAGTGTRVFFEVKNVSTRDFGSESDLKRKLSLLLQGSGEHGGAFDLKFVDREDGKEKPLSHGVFKAIEKLKAGQSRIVEASIHAPPGIEAQSAFTVQGSLGLGEASRPDHERTVQRRRHRITIVEGYEKSPGSDVLLISNGQSTREELKAWKENAARLGLKVDAWSLSYYGFLEMARELRDGKSTLLDDWKGKTVVLLNNSFESDANRSVKPREYLSKREFLEATNAKGINFLVVGDTEDGQGGSLVRSLLVPTHEKPETYLPSVSAFKAALEKQGPDRFGHGVNPGDRSVVTDTPYRVGIARKYYWRKPSPQHLASTARDLQHWLDQTYPHRRYVVVPKYSGQVLKKGGHLSSDKIDLGDIVVRQMADPPENVAIALQRSPAELHDPQQVRSRPTFGALAAALPFPKKLVALDRLLGELNHGKNVRAEADAVSDAILADLSVELTTAYKGYWRRFGQTHERLPKLERLSTFAFLNKVQPGSPAEAQVKRLVAGVHAMADSSWSYWNLWSTFFRVTNDRATGGWAYEYVDRFGAKAYASPAGWDQAQRGIDREERGLLAEAKAMARQNRTSSFDEIYRRMNGPLVAPRVTAASQEWLKASDRVMGSGDYEAFAAQERLADETRTDIVRSAQKARASLGLGGAAEGR